ncbi:hypothetical protein CFBP2533_12820 [Xanthomonas hortorum pv. pelargonii]|uniref:Transposase IS4-like domain-containing protein n=1 Tax=Xanthomonas hortorum pv. pelargonii TaxID=453602 RepID=A0A6V7CGV8_9XANT|nr:hypothetical protein CFBP2533_12820 [Xanthomonas hortorum pv. pelargonii]CAD0315499.1 hypothetical protein CFBP2533_12820 [Xanthomonas hortorum pv. pelargonii]
MFKELLDGLPAISGKPGRPRRWLGKLHADKAYDIKRCRTFRKQSGTIAPIARNGIQRNYRLGRHRWVVERTHAWLAGMGKLRIRFERRIDIHLALLSLACSTICLQFLPGCCEPLLIDYLQYFTCEGYLGICFIEVLRLIL